MNPKFLQLAVFSLWGICVILGLAVLAKHRNTPGEPIRPAGESSVEQAVARLSPAELRPFLAQDSAFTLIVLAHPRCPCTQATLHELQRLIPRLDGKVALHAYFAIPAGKTDDFAEGANLRLAQSLPGMKITLIPAAEIVGKLGGGTSGQVIVFDHGGRLKFQGGITAGRGHEGDNPGEESIRALVATGSTRLASTPVYGCSLREVRTVTTPGNPGLPAALLR